MLEFAPTGQFRKDIKALRKRKNDLDLIEVVVNKLLLGEALSQRHQDHKLVADYVGHRECHIGPDWLLVYRVDQGRFIAVRTGSHSDLF